MPQAHQHRTAQAFIRKEWQHCLQHVHTVHNTKIVVSDPLLCAQMVFSSSCTVYGDVPQSEVPIKETNRLAALSPYGRSKLIIEDMFRDVAKAEPDWKIIMLRYFNPVGAHPSGGHAVPEQMIRATRAYLRQAKQQDSGKHSDKRVVILPCCYHA